MKAKPDYFIGLDLGQASEFTALAVVERPSASDDDGADAHYSLRHLRRFPLGTAYTAIVPTVAKLVETTVMLGETALVVDQTAVGCAVVEMLRRAPIECRIVPVAITSGHTVTVTEERLHLVPKKELVTCLQLLLQGRRLKVPETLPDASMLVKELGNFRIKAPTTVNDTVEAWREGQHDDLVLALALACWFGEREPRWSEGALASGGESAFAHMPKDVFETGGLRHFNW
jgi:hypothetical protein